MTLQALAMLVVTACFLNGCGIVQPMVRSERKLSRIAISAERSAVILAIGDPDAVRGAKKLESGSTLQVDEYRLYGKGVGWFDLALCPFTITLTCWLPAPRFEPTSYWVQYIDGKVDKWGRAGDWTPDLTQDITIRQR
jgi:hypothetical protein